MPYKYQFQLNETNLYRLGIPYPTSWTYAPYGRVEMRGDGSRAGFGYPIVTWAWETLGQPQLHRLLGLFAADGDASIALTVQTYKDTTADLDPDEFTAFMHRPIDGDGKTLAPRVHPQRAAYTGVTIQFTHLVEV